MHEHVTTDPQVCHGQPCVRGTRIPASQIVLMLENGDRVEDLLEEYPSITREDVPACLDYAGGRGVRPAHKFFERWEAAACAGPTS